jgi:hypothetical protein
MYASQYSGIPAAFLANAKTRDRALVLVAREAIPGKVSDGGSRLNDLRSMLSRVVSGEMSPTSACSEIERLLPRSQSMHYANNRVFATAWGERLVRTQVSRFYNQAVLELQIEDGAKTVFVPHSSEEDGNSPCTQLLAGNHHDCRELLARLVRAYAEGDFKMLGPKIPHHPHCTHVVSPS